MDMPEYDLKFVKTAVTNSKIEYRGWLVQRDIANLGYKLEDVCDCLLTLREDDFDKTHYYEDGVPPDDSYIFHHTKQYSERKDELYIKFCLLNEFLILEIGSFHLPRY